MGSCIENTYLSGQGSLLLAKRDANGNPMGLRPVGNLSALTIGVETEELDHKESCTGTRGIDLTLVTGVTASLSFTLENIARENISLALYGASALEAASTVTDEAKVAYLDLWTPLDKIKVSAVVVTDDTGATTYVAGTDYMVNTEAGSIKPLSTGAITEGQDILIDYAYEDQESIQGITSSAAPELYARFEGLNTANGDAPVVVDVYKVATKPLAELALINEELAEMAIEAKILKDPLRTADSVTSGYFVIRKV